jgi:hypothetical protein
MSAYLQHVRATYPSRTEWFDLDLPWEKRHAMEITTVRKPAGANPETSRPTR